MPKFTYAIVHVTGRIDFTTPALVDWVLSELKKVIPTAESRGWLPTIGGGRVTGGVWNKLNGQDALVSQWIIRLLCDNGFEPFAVTQTASGDVVTTHLRRRED